MKRSSAEMSPGLSGDYPPSIHPEPEVETTDVLVVGAGPAGLMLATNLVRFGIPTVVLDDRPTRTTTGRADGLQPKTIETFKQMRIAEPVLRNGVKIYDISFWNSTPEQPLKRAGREVHYPQSAVDVLEPYICMVHQGMIEELFLKDMAERGVGVRRNCVFEGAKVIDEADDKYKEFPVEAVYNELVEVQEKPNGNHADANGASTNGMTSSSANGVTNGHSEEGEDSEKNKNKNSQETSNGVSDKKKVKVAKKIRAKYLIGCDGAHSSVRHSMPGVTMQGESTNAFWGVLDGVLESDFPDLSSKCAISSHKAGTILCIPRERSMTRLYIELTNSAGEKGKINKATANEAFVMKRAKEILKPYKMEWKSVEWFGVYEIGQRVSSSFSFADRIFIAGDAGHTHSPKAAQGMNVSMHDTYNLAWKLAHVLQGWAKPELLKTYVDERRKIATDLIRFDYEHARAFIKKDVKALVENFQTNIRFISGVGAIYSANLLNLKIPASISPSSTNSNQKTRLFPGQLLPPARATRYVDSNPVDLQLDIPVLGQFRLYFLTPDFLSSKYFLDVLSEFITSPACILGRLTATSLKSPYTPPRVAADVYDLPQRYQTASPIYTPCLITATPQADLEISDLSPPLLRDAKWTVYLDNLESRVSPLRRKWWRWGAIRDDETVIVVVRPDGYVGAVSEPFCAQMVDRAGGWVENYFASFLKDRGGREGR